MEELDMESTAMDKILNLTMPGHLRYQPRGLQPYFGYDILYVTTCEVEIATLRVLGDIGVIPAEDLKQLTDEVIKKVLKITTTEIDRIEREITKHDIRALVRKIQEIIHYSLARWTHIPLTSYDGLDTGRILQFQRAYSQVLKPSIIQVVEWLSEVIIKFADQIQIGRTHGQHALPITIGFWLATVLSRILYNWEKMDSYASQLVGKISGAVGAHNAQLGLGFENLCGGKSFEERVLEKLGLKPARISTQILPPEYIAYFLYACQMLSASFGQLGRDCRNLMRTEISEIAEAFESGQVGSSTMAHKRNPINFEQLEGMWLKNKNEFGKVQDTLISEHQRDLVGSCVARDFPIILINLQTQLNTLLRKNDSGEPFIKRITVNAGSCWKNFKMSSHLILSEPLYIAMQMAGYSGDAHHFVNHTLVPECQKRECNLIDAFEMMAEEDLELRKTLKRIPKEVIELLHHPEKYTGDAKKKALAMVKIGKKQIKKLAA
ncbi:hypothetical protein A3B87_00865 [Candidatus Kuenenbacteria bacterium RIFCSPHIGHO2_02_FULL_39_13]|uniref:Fumarate lyase N-terminal domain-containing protein n=1 Tax=Candidatus Kuenenbacteria bacterium RIFCSPHIGHO2_02_FULL_39_13 TaxID=1798561 RepID=A0A1F6FNH5_9BACT|nr:MAG: hypothetical protein A3B87_00865 [Candidatus Kuenenbacteria bacterium RIFCSPHIGHO2_02_FULL_39_13]